MERIICTTVLVSENGDYCDPKCPRLWEGKTCLNPTKTNVGVELKYEWDYHSKNECEMGTCLTRIPDCKAAELPLRSLTISRILSHINFLELKFGERVVCKEDIKELEQLKQIMEG